MLCSPLKVADKTAKLHNWWT